MPEKRTSRGKAGTLGELIRRERKAKQLSQQALADAAGISVAWLRLLEHETADPKKKKKPSAASLSKICQALALAPDQWKRFFQAAAQNLPKDERSGWLANAYSGQLEPTTLELRASRLYWSVRDPGQRTFEAVADKIKDEGYPSICARAIRAMVENTDRRGWVAHRVWDDIRTGLPARDSRLEAMLIDRYPLRHAIVAELPELTRNYLETQPERDDVLHHWLGRMSAPSLIVSLREQDVLAFGSGRGPFESAKAASLRSGLVMPRLRRIVPLCGNIDARTWADGGERRDADDAVQVFRRRVIDQEPPPLINVAVLAPTPQELPAHLRLDAWQRNPAEMVPNVAVIGIGAFAGRHRLFHHRYDGCETTPRDKLIIDLRRTAKAIDEAANKLQKMRDGDAEYHAVGDVCNGLFLVDPPPRVDARQWRKLQQLVKDFNDRAIVPQIEHFSMIAQKGTVIAVAGGIYKRFAIKTVLTMPSQPAISILVTDNLTAAWLCGEAPEESNP